MAGVGFDTILRLKLDIVALFSACANTERTSTKVVAIVLLVQKEGKCINLGGVEKMVSVLFFFLTEVTDSVNILVL